jgi:hypothetical protein
MTTFNSGKLAHLLCIIGIVSISSRAVGQPPTAPRIVSRVESGEMPGLHATIFGSASGASGIYLDATGTTLRSGDLISNDNGRTWRTQPMTPDFYAGLPKGYRRNPVTSVSDHKTGRLLTIVNALDVPDLDPNINEPPIALNTYYLRYRVSADKGRTWAKEGPIIVKGKFDALHPLSGVEIGKNSIFLGDLGCIPIVTRKGRIMVPAQATLLGPDGKLANPGGGYTYTDVVILIGKWKRDHSIEWTMGGRVQADPARSSRGMIEPTLAELPDGRIMMVMRGSNDAKPKDGVRLPGHKWVSVSADGGKRWSKPEPFCFDDGSPFFSPSAMSTLFRHSSGRIFWFGNISERNPEGNLPRWPLMMAEVDPVSTRLIRSTLVTLDTETEKDRSRGRLDISHFSMLEDRETQEIILTYPRNHGGYKEREWVTTRLAVK